MSSTHNITSLNILEEIASANPAISEFSFSTLDPAPLLQERSTLSTLDNQVAEAALALRRELKLPFWDGALLSCSNQDEVPAGILRGASFHQSLEGKCTHIKADAVSVDLLSELSTSACIANKILAVNSTLKKFDGSISHLPLIDFHVSSSPTNTILVSNLLSHMGLCGWLLGSGKSYHFYGAKLLSKDELISFLGRFLLFSPIVDRSWIAHQLIEGCCTLRISPRPEYGSSPILVKRIELA